MHHGAFHSTQVLSGGACPLFLTIPPRFVTPSMTFPVTASRDVSALGGNINKLHGGSPSGFSLRNRFPVTTVGLLNTRPTTGIAHWLSQRGLPRTLLELMIKEPARMSS